MPCLDEWEVARSFTQAHMMEEGLWFHLLPQETLALQWYHDYQKKVWHTTHSKPL
jgi:hypothetical protein